MKKNSSSKTKLIVINGGRLTIAEIADLVSSNSVKIQLDSKALRELEKSHTFLTNAVNKNDTVIYGVNTGFGPMANYLLAQDQIKLLQKNLVLSHAVGLGQKLPDTFVLAAMIVRLNTLVKGYSGISKSLAYQLTNFINKRIIPMVPEHGAVGTSGDLVQLAHIALGLLGKGQGSTDGKLVSIDSLLKKHKISPYVLKPKEGLSLINGTSMMTGIAAVLSFESMRILSIATRAGALALELVQGFEDSFGARLHELRPHPGQMVIARALRRLLVDSSLIQNRKILHKRVNKEKVVKAISGSVQEIYSFRCIAQILGPVYDTLTRTWDTVEIEMNAVTDNPILDRDRGQFLHGGNFHGEYIAAAADELKARIVKLTMLSERRLNFFLNHKVNQIFPPFLNLDTPGLTLGLQGLQFVATSTTAHSQTLAFPMSIHSISTNADNQDVVSMGTDATLLLKNVIDNAYIVLAIELVALAQGVEYLKVKPQLSKASRELVAFVRQFVKPIIGDREVQTELQSLANALRGWEQANLEWK